MNIEQFFLRVAALHALTNDASPLPWRPLIAEPKDGGEPIIGLSVNGDTGISIQARAPARPADLLLAREAREGLPILCQVLDAIGEIAEEEPGRPVGEVIEEIIGGIKAQ